MPSCPKKHQGQWFSEFANLWTAEAPGRIWAPSAFTVWLRKWRTGRDSSWKRSTIAESVCGTERMMRVS